LTGMMALGNLVPDTLVLDVLATRISEPDCAGGLILDGFPRTLRQAELFECGLLRSQFYSNDQKENLVVLHLRVQNSTIVGRLSGRRICSRCSATYHVENQPPRVNGECDFDGSALTIRDDDRKATVLKRLRLYERQTVPVLNHYAETASLLEIDGEQPRGNSCSRNCHSNTECALHLHRQRKGCPANSGGQSVKWIQLQTGRRVPQVRHQSRGRVERL